MKFVELLILNIFILSKKITLHPSCALKKSNITPKVGQVQCRITSCYWSHLHGQTPTAAKKRKKEKEELHSSLILHSDVSVQTKTLCKRMHTKKSLLVSGKCGFSFSCTAAKGINKKEWCGKKKDFNQTRVFSVKSCQPGRNGAHALRVQFFFIGDRPD